MLINFEVRQPPQYFHYLCQIQFLASVYAFILRIQFKCEKCDNQLRDQVHQQSYVCDYTLQKLDELALLLSKVYIITKGPSTSFFICLFDWQFIICNTLKPRKYICFIIQEFEVEYKIDFEVQKQSLLSDIYIDQQQSNQLNINLIQNQTQKMGNSQSNALSISPVTHQPHFRPNNKQNNSVYSNSPWSQNQKFVQGHKKNQNLDQSPINGFSINGNIQRKSNNKSSKTKQQSQINNSDIHKLSLASKTDMNLSRVVQSRLNSLPVLAFKNSHKNQVSSFEGDNNNSNYIQIQFENKLKGKYIGEITDDKANGAGKVYLSNGDYLEGEFQSGRVHGQGRYIKADGSYYEGQFKNNEADGYGKYREKQGLNYEGMWKNNLPNGQGEIVYPDDSRYLGEFLNGKRNGKGTYIIKADTYEGEFKNNKIQGYCQFKGENGQKYSGQWKNGLKQGKGVYQWPSGMRYEGQYKNDQRQGYGIMIYFNNQKYEGMWRGGKKHGQGQYSSSKQKIRGLWVKGDLKQIFE